MDLTMLDTPTFAARRARLLGREREAAELVACVDAAHHSVVTVTGIGGSGKTSLAVEVGHLLADQFGRRWFVDLTAIDHAADVAVQVCHALGLRAGSRSPQEVLTTELQRGPALLILDNCEHVLDPVAHLVGVLATACPELTVVATSRRPLDVPGERILPLGPLPVTTDDGGPGPAVRLLVERARASGVRLDPAGSEAPHLISVCRRLDGLPLPIVLAATQLRSLSPADLDGQLARDLTLPARRGGVVHQRTLTASLDWSLDLLSEPARDLYGRIGVFRRAFDAPLAQSVAREGTPAREVDAALVELVDHSLLLADTGRPATRYRMIAVVREHSHQRLDTAARTELAVTYRRAMLERVAAHRDRTPYFAPAQVRDLEDVHDDVLAALDAAVADGDSSVAFGLISGMIRFWRVTGRIRFGLDRTATTAAVLEPWQQAIVGFMVADQERLLGLLDDAEKHARDSLTAIRDAGPSPWLAFALGVSGDVAAAQGRYDLARRTYLQIRELYDSDVDPRLHALWCANLGGIELESGRDPAARELLELARDIFAVHPPVWLAGRVHGHLGVLARRRGDLADALDLALTGLGELASYNALAEAAPLIDELATTLLVAGRPQDADECRRAAVDMRRRIGSPAPQDTCTPATDALTIADVVALGRRAPVRAPAAEVLTPREAEVALLVADGLTNPQIAERLVISPGTARTHVERIRTKLGVSSRVQVARWVLERYVDRQTP